MKNMSQNNTGEQSSPNSDLLQSQTNAQEQENSSPSVTKIIERDPIEDTPFVIVTIEQGSFIALGNRRITEYMPKDECKRLIKDRNWELITNLSVTVYERMAELNKRD